MRMDGIEQITVTVADVAVTVRFYTQTLGLLAASFGAGAMSLHAGQQRLLLRQGEGPIEAIGLGFVTQTAMPIITGHLAARGVAVTSGPQRRADGRESVVILDPDGHRVEVISSP